MKHWTRAALGCAAAGVVAVCGAAASGKAALNPTFSVISTGTGANLWARIADTDPSPARLTVYVPAGYGFTPPAAGRQAGTATVDAITDIGPSEASLLGTITAGATPSAADAACDPGTHVSALAVKATGSSTELDFVLFVDRTSGTEAQLGSYRLVACFSSSNARPVTDKNGVNDTRVVGLRLRNLPFHAPRRPGDYRWRSVWVPYTTNGGDGTNGTPTTPVLDPAQSTEAESVVHAPAAASIAAHGHVVSGRVTGAGAGVRVVIFTGTTRLHLVRAGSTTTKAGGTYRFALRAKRAAYVRVEAQVAGRALGHGGCAATSALTAPCAGATVGAADVTSRIVAVR